MSIAMRLRPGRLSSGCTCNGILRDRWRRAGVGERSQVYARADPLLRDELHAARSICLVTIPPEGVTNLRTPLR